MATCSTPDCGKTRYARGRCKNCYQRWRKSPSFKFAVDTTQFHRISDVNTDVLEGVCSVCGLVDVYGCNTGFFRCGPLQRGRLQAYRGTKAWQNTMLRRKYGIGIEDYNALHAAQNGVCAICKQLPGNGSANLCVDHCHRTGQVRGLLCVSCNAAIGLLGDRLENVLAAAIYLGAEVELA